MGEALRVIRGALEAVRLGPPLTDREGRLPHVTVYPLLAAAVPEGPPGLLTLSDGRDGGALIEEVSCEDAVRISNPLDLPILGGESECIVGRTQNRALKHDVLVPPHTSRYALVNCVERGQPTRPGKEFAVGPVCPWSLRLDKMRQLSDRGRVDQGRVWDQVDRFLARAGSPSATRDLHSAFDRRRREMARSLPSFPPLPGQLGMMSTIGSHIYLDMVSDPELLMRRHEGLMMSALMEGVVGFSDVRVPLDAARRALDGLLDGIRSGRSLRPLFSSPGDRDLVAWGPGVNALAFLGDGRLSHLAAHWTWSELEAGHAGRAEELARARLRYLAENRESLGRTREVCASRHRAYGEFLSNLRSLAPMNRMQARRIRGTAGPLPGPRIGIDEADPPAPFPEPMPFQELAGAVAARATGACRGFSADLTEVGHLLEGLKMDPSPLRRLP